MKRGKKKFVVVVVLMLAALAVWATTHFTGAKNGAAPTGTGRGEGMPVPVVEGTVAAKDVSIYLDGLGTVQAFNTVTVRSRVDGQLVKVAFTEGQDVREGQLLVQIDPAPFQAQLDQVAAKKAQDEAQLLNAETDLVRYADLLKTESTTQQTYDTQKALIAQLKATIKADEAAINNAKVQLEYTTIRSPIDGRVGIRLVDQGNMVHSSDANGLLVLTQLKPISVIFTLPEQDLPKIQDQHSVAADFVVEAFARDNTTKLGEGKLAVIDNQIDSTTGTIKLKATFPNQDLRLWPGQFVNARLLLTIRKNQPIVPAAVIQRGPEGAFAFVIKPDQTVEMRKVTVGQIDHGEAMIEKGLEAGERVVVDGQYKLQVGSRVRPIDAEGKGGSDKRGGKGQRGKKP